LGWIGAALFGCSRCSARTTGAEYAELVAFGIRKDDPWLLTLTYVNTRSSEGEHPLHLTILIIGPKIQMEPVLRSLRLRNGDKEQSRESV